MIDLEDNCNNIANDFADAYNNGVNDGIASVKCLDLRELMELWKILKNTIEENHKALEGAFMKIIEGLVAIEDDVCRSNYEIPNCRCGGTPEIVYNKDKRKIRCQRCGMQTEWRLFDTEAKLDWIGVTGK